MSITSALTAQRHSDRAIAAEYAAEYARGHEQAALWIWWALMCGRAPDMVPYAWRPGVDAVWVRDTDLCDKGQNKLAADPEPISWKWITRENAQQQIQRDADRANEAAQFEARQRGWYPAPRGDDE